MSRNPVVPNHNRVRLPLRRYQAPLKCLEAKNYLDSDLKFAALGNMVKQEIQDGICNVTSIHDITWRSLPKHYLILRA
jgi:hypothetical protein